MSAIGKLAKALRMDGWVNTLTGLGLATRDKVQAARFYQRGQLPDDTLEAMYYGDDLCARIVSAVVDEAMRRGFEVEAAGEGDGEEGDDDDTEGAIWDRCEALDVCHKAKQAATWARLLGGGALWVGANDGQDSASELNEERIASVDFLHVLDKRDMTPETYYTDPASPLFGQVEMYRVNLSSRQLGMGGVPDAMVHASRLIMFPGAPTSDRERSRLAGWDHSVIDAVYDVLVGANSNWQSVQYLMTDASQAVYKVKGLVELLAAGQEDTMRTRMETVEMGRSSARAIILDADGEEFTRQATPFTGLPDVIDRTWQRLAAAARMPVTVLMGMSPAGLNATGESDTRHWYDQVQMYREQVLRPRLLRLVRMIARSVGADPLDWEVCFPSLWQPTDKEVADTRKVVADTDKVYIDAGVLLPEEVAVSRFGESGYSAETKVDLDVRKSMLEAELVKAEENAGKPDPEPMAAPVEDAPPPAPEPEPEPKADALDSLAKVAEVAMNLRLAGMPKDEAIAKAEAAAKEDDQ